MCINGDCASVLDCGFQRTVIPLWVSARSGDGIGVVLVRRTVVSLRPKLTLFRAWFEEVDYKKALGQLFVVTPDIAMSELRQQLNISVPRGLCIYFTCSPTNVIGGMPETLSTGSGLWVETPSLVDRLLRYMPCRRTCIWCFMTSIFHLVPLAWWAEYEGCRLHTMPSQARFS